MSACAGNGYTSDNNSALYPGAYANAFSVTNIDSTDQRNANSNTGDYIDIAAPGK